MDTIICHKCKMEKPLSEFHKCKKKKKGHNTMCKSCRKDYIREHYNKDKKYYFDKNKNNRIKKVNWLNSLKEKLRCEVCGENHISCLDFHHIDPSLKKICVAQAVHETLSKKRILEEIEKCKVLCANCHRDFHFKNDTRGKKR